MQIFEDRWNVRFFQAKRSELGVGLVLMTALRDDIEALADSVFRAGYRSNPILEIWLGITNRVVYNYKAG